MDLSMASEIFNKIDLDNLSTCVIFLYNKAFNFRKIYEILVFNRRFNPSFCNVYYT